MGAKDKHAALSYLVCNVCMRLNACLLEQTEKQPYIFGVYPIAVYLMLWLMEDYFFKKEMNLIYLLHSSIVLQPVWVAAVRGRRRGDM